jgi:signal transduction histidine kinase
MIRNSLRLRLVAGGSAAIICALVIAGLVLTVLFERHVDRNLADDLEIHLNRLIAGIDPGPDGQVVLSRAPTDPRFSEPLSGLYWQISDDRQQPLRSRSLWDTTLSLPPDDPAPGEVHLHKLAGPAASRILLAERRVYLTIGGQRVPVRVAVAADLGRVAAARTAFATDLALALTLLGIALALATWVQVNLGLRPLDALRRAVAEIRSQQGRRLTARMPEEVQSLVNEVNALLEAREQDIERSHHRASDLAHGLKTPLAALSADSDRLRQKGEAAIADDIQTVIDAMRRHVDRELARARLRRDDTARHGIATAVAPLVRSIVATLSRTEAGSCIRYDIKVDSDALVRIDRTDLAEVLGNLLENATNHARSCVRIETSPAGPGSSIVIAIAIEDDGKGIASDLRSIALARGGRLDERGSGTGLGLAIVQDVLEAYGWTLHLKTSGLGGLKAYCRANTTAQEPP